MKRFLLIFAMVLTTGTSKASLVNFSVDLNAFSSSFESTEYSYQGGSIGGNWDISEAPTSTQINQITGETVSRFSLSGSIHSQLGSASLGDGSYAFIIRSLDLNGLDVVGFSLHFPSVTLSSNLQLVALDIQKITSMRIPETPIFPNINSLSLAEGWPIYVNSNISPTATSGVTFSVSGNNVLFQQDVSITPAPIPAAAWLMVSGMGLLGATAKRRKAYSSGELFTSA